MLYSHNNEYPTQLPNRIRMPDGSTRTDKSTFTDEEIAEAGYVAVGNKPAYAGDTQKVEWDITSGDWVVVALNEAELQAIVNQKWAAIREERDSLLAATDHIILIHYEQGEPVPETMREYRQALRDLPQTYDNLSDIEWPTLSVTETDGVSDIETSENV